MAQVVEAASHWEPIIGALLGVVVGFSLQGASDFFKRKRILKSLRKSILYEVNTMIDFYYNHYFDTIEKLKDGEILEKSIYVKELKLYVYEANADKVSEFKKEAQLIVSFYAKAKSMVDSLLQHTDILEKYEQPRSLTGRLHERLEVGNLESRLIRSSRSIKSLHEELVPLGEKLIKVLGR